MNSCALSDNPSPQRRRRSLRENVGEEAAVAGAPVFRRLLGTSPQAAGRMLPLQIHQSQLLFLGFNVLVITVRLDCEGVVFNQPQTGMSYFNR